MVPDLLVGGGGVGGGAFSGLSINTSRGHLYRATLEALSAKLAHQLHELERICGFKAEELILVGGGSKNRLWNQIKADALKIPVRAVADEMTVLGAALWILRSGLLPDAPSGERGRLPRLSGLSPGLPDGCE